MSPINKASGEHMKFNHPLKAARYEASLGKDRFPESNKSYDENRTEQWMRSSIDLKMPST